MAVSFYSNQTVEFIFISNKLKQAGNGQNYIYIKNREGKQQLKRLINLEHSKAIAVMPRNVNDYPFFLTEDHIK